MNEVYPDLVVGERAFTFTGVLGIPLVAALHGVYNTLTMILPAAILVMVIELLAAVALCLRLVELSPYRVYPLDRAATAIPSIHRGLVLNPRSPILNRNLGIYLMHTSRYRAAER